MTMTITINYYNHNAKAGITSGMGFETFDIGTPSQAALFVAGVSEWLCTSEADEAEINAFTAFADPDLDEEFEADGIFDSVEDWYCITRMDVARKVLENFSRMGAAA